MNHCTTCTCGKRAPVLGGREDRRKTGPGVCRGTITWDEHLLAWAAYAVRHSDQDANKIAERGGFGYDELVKYLGREPTTWVPG